jgi:hypothetical protein
MASVAKRRTLFCHRDARVRGIWRLKEKRKC